MGSGVSKFSKFYVHNKSSSRAQVNVAQPVKRNVSQTVDNSMQLDVQQAAANVANAENAGEKVLGVLSAAKRNTAKSESFEYVIDHHSYAIVGPGKVLAFRLPSGVLGETFVTITLLDDNNEPKPLCERYSPPVGYTIVIEEAGVMASVRNYPEEQ